MEPAAIDPPPPPADVGSTHVPARAHMAGLPGRLARNRDRLETELGGTARRRWFSPALLGLEAALEPRLREHVAGRLLDAGCGRQPYRRWLGPLVDRYESIDVQRRVADLTWEGDVCSMPSVPSCAFDTVLCSEVLEHVPRPSEALAEIGRVLRPGGRLILSVPFLARLHEEPHDYYRYTRHGLSHLLEENGFSVLELVRTGSVFGFGGHQLSTLLVCGTWHLPVVRWLVFALNAALVTLPCHWADRLLGSDRMPLGYVVVAERQGAPVPRPSK